MTNAKTFRLFISSTFSDFNQERRLLQTYVFPEIKKYCRELGKGYIFQPIDLRWGVSNEAQLDQKALELCIEEVQSSKSQPHPNFLIMAGSRYGWVPLPYAIEQKEFEAIRENVEDTTLLDTWYKLDNNQLPASYIIQKRSGEYEAYDTWAKVEDSLREILQEAVNKTPLSNVEKEKYFTSATESEVIEGIFGYKTITSFQDALTHKDSNYPLLDSEHLYGYIRDVKSVEDDSFSKMFIDADVTQANNFKDELRGVIKQENLLDEIAHLTKLSKDEKNGSLAYTYEAIENDPNSLFVTTMIAFLKRSIESYEVEEASTPQKLEENEQERFKEDKLKLFIGREEPLKAIQEYIENDNNQPLVIYGPSGMGKSALMAKAIDETTKEKVYRFVGSTASLTSSEQLLISILKAFGIEEQIRQIKDEKTGQEKPEPIEAFYLRAHDYLKNIPDEKVIFIDAVDQLTNEDEFIWLPSKLPSNLKIIISALEDDTYPEDTQYFTALKKKTSNLYKLDNFEESETLIRSILKQYNRSITDTQLVYLKTIYQDVNTPLYLTIAAQEIRHWSSEDKTIDVDPNGQELAPTQKGVIAEYIENLTELYHHDEELIKRVLSYLYLTNGLGEAELLELLSVDEAFVEKMAPETYHNNVTKELPSVIWARLHTQLKEFIKLEEKDGQETMSFFHREFNDSISKQKDIQATHEELIALVYKLIEKYQNEPFESNRWGELYIEIVKNYYIEYEFDEDYEIDSNFKVYIERLLELDNEIYLFYILSLYPNDYTENEKYTICFYLFKYYLMTKLYESNPDRWACDYATNLRNLADSYIMGGELIIELIIKLFEEAVSIRQTLYKSDPDRWAEDYLSILSYLPYTFEGLGEIQKAIEQYEEAIRIMRQTLYKSDPNRWAEDYTTNLKELAYIYGEEGQIQKAIELHEEAIRIMRQTLYKSDPDRWAEDYVTNLVWLAYYLNEDQIQKAIELYEEVISIMRQTLYKNDPDRWAEDYTTNLNNLAYKYDSLEEYEKAEPLYMKCLEIREQILGEAHNDTLNTLYRVAETYIKLNNSKEANYYCEKYFKTIDFNDYIDDIAMFIYLFIKWYQFVQKENDTRKIEKLNEFAKNTIAFYKEKLGSKYNETIQREYDLYSELKDESGIQKTKIFQKIFIDENNDSDIK